MQFVDKRWLRLEQKMINAISTVVVISKRRKKTFITATTTNYATKKAEIGVGMEQRVCVREVERTLRVCARKREREKCAYGCVCSRERDRADIE